MNKEIFEAYIKIWNEGNYDLAKEYLSENFIRNVPKTANQSTNNLNGAIEIIQGFRTAFPDGKVTINEVYFSEDLSFSKFTYTGTNTGDGDFPATGNAVSVSGSSIARYENGKMIQEDVYYDTLGFMAQLGIIELPSEESATTA